MSITVQLERGRRLESVASGGRSVPGHHGTRAEWADQILAEGLRPSESKQDYLGDGSYFFEDAPDLADEWARLNHPDHETCILEAEIALSRCLDLLDGVGQDMLKPFYERFICLRGRDTVAMLKQKETDAYGDFDCNVINLACESMAEDGVQLDVVRGAIRVGGPIYKDEAGELPESRFWQREHIQLAVRNNCAILACRRKDNSPTGRSGQDGAR